MNTPLTKEAAVKIWNQVLGYKPTKPDLSMIDHALSTSKEANHGERLMPYVSLEGMLIKEMIHNGSIEELSEK